MADFAHLRSDEAVALYRRVLQERPHALWILRKPEFDQIAETTGNAPPLPRARSEHIAAESNTKGEVLRMHKIAKSQT